MSIDIFFALREHFTVHNVVYAFSVISNFGIFSMNFAASNLQAI